MMLQFELVDRHETFHFTTDWSIRAAGQTYYLLNSIILQPPFHQPPTHLSPPSPSHLEATAGGFLTVSTFLIQLIITASTARTASDFYYSPND